MTVRGKISGCGRRSGVSCLTWENGCRDMRVGGQLRYLNVYPNMTDRCLVFVLQEKGAA